MKLLHAFGLLAIAGLVMASSAAGQPTAHLRIYVDENIRISYDGDPPHEEAPIAASASNPNLLYAAAEMEYPGRVAYASVAQLYYSHDQGVQWHPVLLPNEIGGGWDNAMAAGMGGTDYFITHTDKTGLTLYTTHDGGLTWVLSHIPPDAHPTDAGLGGWDREYAIVDNTHGRFAGRLYVAGEGHLDYLTSPKYSSNINKDGVKVVSSSDGGKTFSAPAMACHRPQWHTNTKPHIVVMSDGTIVVPCSFYPPLEVMQSRPSMVEYEDFGVATSSDGGRTFSPYHPIGYHLMHHPSQGFGMKLLLSQRMDPLIGVGSDTIALAVGPKGGIYADRLYIAWPSFTTDEREIMYLSHSDNRGVTWSTPKAVYPVSYGGGWIREALPMLAVNQAGILGVGWFDGRNTHGTPGYDVYFTASLDGGAHFLPVVRVTSQTSFPEQGTDIHGRVISSDDDTSDPADYGISGPPKKTEKYLRFTTPFHGRPLGGDYSTMAVDAAGNFHPMWPDTRDGEWQLYTSTIRVIPPLSPSIALVRSPSCQLGDHLKLLMGDPQVDLATQEATFFVRLENVSSEILVHPLAVHVQAIPRAVSIPGVPPLPTATLRDPSTGSYQTSINVIYPLSLDRPLFPHAATVAEPWRIHFPGVATLRAQITGLSHACTP